MGLQFIVTAGTGSTAFSSVWNTLLHHMLYLYYFLAGAAGLWHAKLLGGRGTVILCQRLTPPFQVIRVAWSLSQRLLLEQLPHQHHSRNWCQSQTCLGCGGLWRSMVELLHLPQGSFPLPGEALSLLLSHHVCSVLGEVDPWRLPKEKKLFTHDLHSWQAPCCPSRAVCVLSASAAGALLGGINLLLSEPERCWQNKWFDSSVILSCSCYAGDQRFSLV